MGIVWIASYPKSGNTWVRFLLANYFAGPITDSARVEAAVPSLTPTTDLVGLLATHSPLCMKTHFPWSIAHPFSAQTEKAIVIVRYPKDILLSNLHYHRLLAGNEDGYSDLTYARAFIAAGADPLWMEKRGYGTLEAHVGSWLDNPTAPPRLLVRYEDLARDTGAELGRILSFLNLAVDWQRVQSAVAASSFHRMREIETREKSTRSDSPVFPGQAPQNGSGRFFVNRGRIGSSLAHIDPKLDEAFESRFGLLMRRLGYNSLAPSLPFTGTAAVRSAPSSPLSDGLSRSA